MEYIGLKFLNYDYYECEVIKQYNSNTYLVKDSIRSKDNGQFCAIMTPEDINGLLSKQDKIKAKMERAKQREKAEYKLQQKDKQQEENKNNLYGFDKDKTPMQKAKILKCLLTSVLHNNKLITRKELIIYMIKNGYIPKIKTIKGKNKYVIEKHDIVEFYECTKTEYDFAMYLKYNINL